MIPENLMLPLMEFVRRAHKIPSLNGAVLFGSAVKGEMGKKSDLDILLLFDTDHNPEVGKEMDMAWQISSEIAKKYDLPYSFSFVAKNLNDPRDVEPDFLWNIAKEGLLIWGKPDLKILKAVHPSLEAFVLIKFSTKKLSSKDKGAIRRALFGFKVIKRIGGKTYVSQKSGLIDKKKYKVGPGILLVPARISEAVLKVLKKHKAQYSSLKLWQ